MFILKANQQVPLSVAYADKKGNPAIVDGFPVWSVSDTAIATIIAGPNPFSVTVKAVGTPGTVQVSVVADADRGEGVQNIVGLLELEVIPGDAAVVTIGTGAVEDQAEPVVEPTPEEPAPVEPEPEVPVEPEPAPVEPEVPVEPTPVEPEPAPVEPEVPVEPTPEDPIVEG